MSDVPLSSRRVRLVVVATLAVAAFLVGLVSGRDGLERLPADQRAGPSQSQRAPLLLPSAGYVVEPEGSFMTSASGRAIESFALPVRCGSRSLMLDDVPLTGRLLRFRGRAVGREVVVQLTARILDTHRVRGTVAVRGARCPSGQTAFTARVS